jgi:hypothetical protein
MPVDIDRVVTELAPGETVDGISEATVERIVAIVMRRLDERERQREAEREEARIPLSMRPRDRWD